MIDRSIHCTAILISIFVVQITSIATIIKQASTPKQLITTMSLYTQLTALVPIIFSHLPHILLTVILLYVTNFYVSYVYRENPLPGPIPLPIIGNLYHMSDMYKFLVAMHKQHGDAFEFYVGNKRIVMLNRADLAENNVLRQSIKSNYFVRVTSASQGWQELGLTEKGLFSNTKLKNWAFNRRFLSHCLTSGKYMKEIFDVAHNRFLEAEEYWKELGDNTPLEFTKWMHCMTVDTKIKIITGEQTYALPTYANSLLPPHLQKPLPQSSIQSYSEFVSHLLYRSSIGRFFYTTPPFFRHYVPGFKQIAARMKAKVAWLNEEVKKIVRNKKQLIESMDDKQELKIDLLSLMLTTNTERDTNRIKASEIEEPLDENEIVSIHIEVFLAVLAQ